MANEHSYGGQAVLEGVMMRGRSNVSVAVRTSENDIVLREDGVASWTDRFPFLKWPLVRGSLVLVESLIIGMRALNYSASVFAEGEGEEIGFKETVLSVVLAVILTVCLFVALPAFLIRTIQARIEYNIVLNLIEGLLKIGLFVGYIAVISLMKDIRRVFEYHGAEHKTINCLEAGKELTVENVREFGAVHTRCGTNFIVVVLLTSIFIFSFFGRPPLLQRILIHLTILPLVAGISYEVIKRAGKKEANPLLKVIARPGMWLQALTTREPDDSQIEVAIRALRSVLQRDAEAAVTRDEC